MGLQIADRVINRVAVIDDSEDLRLEYGYPLEEMGLEAVYEAGPLTNLEESLANLRAKADAVVCDYHLRKKNFSKFDGDQLVAKLNSANLPALLCSTFTDSAVTVLRSKRRYIPSLLKPATFTPDSIRQGFERCVYEAKGKFESTRRPWRTLVRAADVEIEGQYFYVIVPGWDAEQKLRVYFDDTPPDFKHLVKPGSRFHAQVNIGANTADELYFYEWEKS